MGLGCWISGSYYARNVVKEDFCKIQTLTDTNNSFVQVIVSDGEVINLMDKFNRIIDADQYRIKVSRYSKYNMGINWIDQEKSIFSMTMEIVEIPNKGE